MVLTKLVDAADEEQHEGVFKPNGGKVLGGGVVTRSKATKLVVPPEEDLKQHRIALAKGLFKPLCPTGGNHEGKVLGKGKFIRKPEGMRLYIPLPEEVWPSEKPDNLTEEEYARCNEQLKELCKGRPYTELLKKGAPLDEFDVLMFPEDCDCDAIPMVRSAFPGFVEFVSKGYK